MAGGHAPLEGKRKPNQTPIKEETWNMGRGRSNTGGQCGQCLEDEAGGPFCTTATAGRSRRCQTFFLRLKSEMGMVSFLLHSMGTGGHESSPDPAWMPGEYLSVLRSYCQRWATMDAPNYQLQEVKHLSLGKEAWGEEICDFITNLVGIGDLKTCACITLIKMKYKMDYLVLNETAWVKDKGRENRR